KFLAPRKDELCSDCRRRLEINPLRVFDCKVESDQAILSQAPVVLDYLCDACREHFATVRAHLERMRIPFEVDARLVRGLDYYRRTAFEVTRPALGAQNALLGGGRYDGLVESLGGPSVPGFGFAAGEDRLVMALPETAAVPDPAPEVFLVAPGGHAF